MASLLDKVSTLISANLHYMMDQALQSNSPAIIDQYIREVEHNLADLEDAAATVGGEVKSLHRKVDEFQLKSDELDRAVNAFLMEGNESAAAAAQSKLNSSQRLVETYIEQSEAQDGEFHKLLDAKVKLEARIAETIQKRLDKANTAGEMRASSLDAQMDAVLETSALDLQLAERRKKLGLIEEKD